VHETCATYLHDNSAFHLALWDLFGKAMDTPEKLLAFAFSGRCGGHQDLAIRRLRDEHPSHHISSEDLGTSVSFFKRIREPTGAKMNIIIE